MLLRSREVSKKFCRFFYFIFSKENKLKLFIVIIAISLVTDIGLSHAAKKPSHEILLRHIASSKTAVFPQYNNKTTASTKPSVNLSTTVDTTPPSTTSIVTTAPNCSPDDTYIPAAAIAPRGTGLTIIFDSPSTYTIYGNTVSQIETEMISCTPVTSSGTGGFVGKFAASTANDMSWQVNFNSDGNGICSISNASVLVHINQVFPKWQATSGATAGLSAQWQGFINELVTYEQGHAKLDEQGATTLLSDLENFPATSCATINQSLNTKAQADINITLAENTAYDKTNDFGPKF
jgi:predicted secreted Zn-dependent protease